MVTSVHIPLYIVLRLSWRSEWTVKAMLVGSIPTQGIRHESFHFLTVWHSTTHWQCLGILDNTAENGEQSVLS